jgi:hypothetical protein
MADDDGAAEAPSGSEPRGPSMPVVSGPQLIHYLAIGRLAVSEKGDLLPDKHRLVAHNFARKDEPDPEGAKAIKSHLKAVLKRAGHKLQPGKRIRLKDDAARYEVTQRKENLILQTGSDLICFSLDHCSDVIAFHSVTFYD